MNRTKVLVVSHACVVDANQTLYRWIEQFPGIELCLIVPRTWQTDLVGHASFRRFSPLQSDVVELTPLFNGRGSLHFYRGAAAPVEAFKPDIIFLDEEPWSFCALQFAALARRTGARLVFYTKQNLPRRYPLPFRLIERHVFKHSAAAAVISDEAAGLLRSKGYRGEIFTLPHGFEPEWFKPRNDVARRRELNLHGTVIGYIGRLAPEKGVHDLIAAAAALRAARPQLSFSVLVVGSGPRESELKELVMRSQLANVVTFVPALPHNQIADIYGCVDVLVVPSRTTPTWKEQFGRVLIEAMASNVCVVGSDSGEIPTVIGDAGLVFAEGNVQALAAALERLIVGDDLRERLRNLGRARALANYSNEVVARQLVSAWQALPTRHY